MKLKYLLPVATIASVATVVTPLVTSCGPKVNYTTIDGRQDITEEMTTWEKSAKTTQTTQDEAFTEYVGKNTAFVNDFRYYLNKFIYKQYSTAKVLLGRYADVKFEKVNNQWYGSWNFDASFERAMTSSYYIVHLKAVVKRWPIQIGKIDALGGTNGISVIIDASKQGLALNDSTLSMEESENAYTLTEDEKPGDIVSSIDMSANFNKDRFEDVAEAFDAFMYASYITQWATYWFISTPIV